MPCHIGSALNKHLLICIAALEQWQAAEQNQNTVEILMQWEAEQKQAIVARECHWMKCRVCNPKVEEE